MNEENPNIGMLQEFMDALEVTCSTKFGFKVTHDTKKIAGETVTGMWIETSDPWLRNDKKALILLEILRDKICEIVVQNGGSDPKNVTVGIIEYSIGRKEFGALVIDDKVLELNAVHEMFTTNAAQTAREVRGAFAIQMDAFTPAL